MVEYQQTIAASAEPDSLDDAIADWLVLGMYTGFRLSEWAQPDASLKRTNTFQRNRDGSSTAITAQDIIFSIKNNPHLFDVRWRFQKNGANGQRITFSNNVARNRCPLQAAMRITQRAQRLGIPLDNPLAVFLDQGSPSFITDVNITFILRRAASQVYKINKADELKVWTSHSIRIGACVALHGAGADFLTLKQRLRWKSDTFFMYLRNTPQLALEHSRLFEPPV